MSNFSLYWFVEHIGQSINYYNPLIFIFFSFWKKQWINNESAIIALTKQQEFVNKQKKNNIERTCSQNQQAKKTNKNKNRDRCTTCSNHRPRKKHKANVYIQHYSEMWKKRKTNKQTLTVTKYWQTICIWRKTIHSLKKIMHLVDWGEFSTLTTNKLSDHNEDKLCSSSYCY